MPHRPGVKDAPWKRCKAFLLNEVRGLSKLARTPDCKNRQRLFVENRNSKLGSKVLDFRVAIAESMA